MTDVFIEYGLPVGDQASVRIVFCPGNILVISFGNQLSGQYAGLPLYALGAIKPEGLAFLI